MGFDILFGAFLMLVCKFQKLHCFDCPGNPDAYINRGDRYCQKVYNCRPGYEIIDCSNNCGSDTCRVCPDGQVQPFLIQSNTPAVDRKCFTPEGHCNGDSVPVRNGKPVRGCSKSETCQCSLYDCWYGYNPCTCNKFRRGCPVDKYFVYDGNAPYCKKCPNGTKKEEVGCGPCQTIPVTPDTHISTTTAATEKPTTTSGLSINRNYSGISPREAETIGFSTLTSEMTTLPTTTPSTEEENDFLLIFLISIGSVSGFLFLFVVPVGVVIFCVRRSHSNGGILNEEKREENANEADNEIETVSRPLIVPQVSLLSEACSTPRSPVVSETGQPGVFHPTDPRALRHIRGLQGRSLGDESQTDSSMNTSGVEDRELLNSSCTETPAVDSVGNSEGVNYFLNKLNDEDTQPKQPVQCEEDTLRSHTFQKYLHSDVTHQKEVLCERGFYSLTNEKLLCPVRCVSDKTDPKYCMDS